MIRVYVRLDNEPVPTGQRDIGTRLLSSYENRHFSNQKLVKVAHIKPLSSSYVVVKV